MSSSPPKMPSQESSSSGSDESFYVNSNDDDDDQVSSNTQTPSRISSFSTHPENLIKNQSIDSWLHQQQPILDQYAKNAPENQSIDSSIQTCQAVISQCAQSGASALDQKPSNVSRPQKPSAFAIKNLMSRMPSRKSPGNPIKIRMSGPHLGRIQSQEEETATGMPQKPTEISRNVKNAVDQIGNVLKPRPWWKKNLRKEKEARALMPPPRQGSSVNKKVQALDEAIVIQKKLKRKFISLEENEKELKRRKLKPQQFDQSFPEGAESRFLFPMSESEGQDDFSALKFLSTYVLNGGTLAPNFRRVVVEFINGILAENCRIKGSRFWEKVVVLHKKFQCLVQENGGENFREADFSTARDYEMAALCKIVWRDRQEGKRSVSYVDPKLVVDPRNDEKKLVSDTVRGIGGISLGDAGVIVDPGNGLSDPEMEVDCGKAAGLVVNVDPGNGLSGQGMNVDHGNAGGLALYVDSGDGADQEVNLDENIEAGANPGMNMDHGNEADPGASADQKKDSGTCLPIVFQAPISGDSEQQPIVQSTNGPTRMRKRPTWLDDYVT